MRLSRIKIAGFKSFVDPTELKLPSALVGIVGPNGCGKSNTIDAVRWVMGESSAKHLRGESMDDVIFLGSRTRQPVGQASVELVFDNSDGSLGGEYAGFGEISVRREVSRDGQSRYMINGVRCRRRDIRDIFLGTGLGPRSYAIIEQGMISRLIEAKPEDMRVYLEEAAGISKYKERRRETETRIRHTRENLDRLNDLREEVEKQIARLDRQAKVAEKFQRLKSDERRKRGELMVLRRRAFEAERDEQAHRISAQETELEAVTAALRSEESAIELARAQQTESSDQFSEIQAEFYRLGSEVVRIEQTIEHRRESRQQQDRELAEINRLLTETRAHLDDDVARITQIDASMASDQPAFDVLKDSETLSAEHLHRAETELQEWQLRFDAFNRGFAEITQVAQIERSRIEQIEHSISAAEARLARLQQERQSLSVAPLQQSIETREQEARVARDDEDRLKQVLEHASEKQQLQKSQIRNNSESLDELRRHQQSLLGRLASLEALQQAALEPASTAADEWLRANDLDQAPRLAQSIVVAPGWETAVELVLGASLEAVCVDSQAVIERCLQSLPDAQLCLMQTTADAATASSESLASKVSGQMPLPPLLAGVRVADSVPEALLIQRQMSDEESVVTRDGLWLGKYWLRVARAESQDSVLLRENEITELKIEIDGLQNTISQAEQALHELQLRQDEMEVQRETQLHAYNDSVRLHSQMAAALSADRQDLQQTERRRRSLQDELTDLEQSLQNEQQQLQVATQRRAEALEKLAELDAEKTQINRDQQLLRDNLESARAQRDVDRSAGQELAIRVESMRSSRAATERNLARMQQRMQQLTERQSALNTALSDDEQSPLESLEANLQQVLAAKLAGENAVRVARTQLDSVETRLREHEQARQRHDARAQSVRETVQNLKMEAQEAVVRLKTIDEQLAEHDFNIAEIVNDLPDDANPEQWAEELANIEKKVERLGPINLAAIDELAEQLARKEYLDEQHLDVSEALATLERAIAKIDRETKSRFKETFDNVNAKLQEYFPRLFGGGHGSLQLTGDDLLNTGVSVSAQPPGKRVSNIQLLSGGEKALTAVALVFAFFELNPSPFCMLDEVDAPLDDANVGRFCELVEEMSERVQFIFITHNKVTMEMAKQLMGVTMNEPGVSRLVAVDVHEAVELAGA